MMLDFSGKVIIVTGAAHGIGRRYAEFLAGRGAAIVVADTGGDPTGTGQSEGPGGDVVRHITANGGKAVNVVASVATEEGAARIVASAIEHFGRIDGLVNNAGIIRMSAFEDATVDLYRSHLEVHLIGTMLVSKAAWPHLVASGCGRIVNTVSGAVAGALDMAHYASAKGGIYSFTRCLGILGADAGVMVNAVSPAADTRMIEVPGMAEALPPGTIDFLREKMSPRWIAPVTAYLLHESCTLNGEVLSAGGGSVSRMVMMNTPGIHSETLSPEEIAERIGEIMDVSKAEVAPLVTLHPAMAH
jgi:NAD(P)-dependent dehydrogenase (short-subunit alcohol dehydrogenase family)